MWQRIYVSVTCTGGSGANSTVTVAGPVSQTGGVTLPSITTCPAFSPPNASATEEPASQARQLQRMAHQVGADALVALVAVDDQPPAQRRDVQLAPVAAARFADTAAA